MRRKRSVGEIAFDGFNYTFLLLLGLGTLFPFVTVFALSMNDPLDALKGGIFFWPREWTTTNYAAILQNDNLALAALMSVLRTVIGTVLSVLATSMVAYTLCRKEFMYRRSINFIIVMTMYVNGGLIPFYLLIKNIGLMNNFAVYILPTLVVAFNVIIVRSYYESLPDGLIESARIDGATELQTLFRIVMPISLPVLATVTLFVSVAHWNSWFDNFLFIQSKDQFNVLQFELMKILTNSINQASSARVDSTSLRQNPETMRAAMTIIVTVPILFVYPFMQRYFVTGMTFAAMKE